MVLVGSVLYSFMKLLLFLTSEACVQSQVTLSWICIGHCGIGMGFSMSTLLLLSVSFCQCPIPIHLSPALYDVAVGSVVA